MVSDPLTHRQFRSSASRQSIRHTSFPARFRVSIQWRMDHLSTLADRPFHGQPNRPSRRRLLRVLPYGVVRPQEDFRRVRHHLFGIHFHPVLCEIAACAFGGRIAGRTGIVASDAWTWKFERLTLGRYSARMLLLRRLTLLRFVRLR